MVFVVPLADLNPTKACYGVLGKCCLSFLQESIHSEPKTAQIG